MNHPILKKGSAWLLIAIFLASCASQPTPAPKLTPTLPQATVTVTPLPTSTPTPLPFATDKNPLVFGVVSETNDPKVKTAADDVAAQITQITGFKITTAVYTNYFLLFSDMNLAKVQIAFFPPLSYLYASQNGFATATLVANHLGVYGFGTRFYANVAGKFTSFYDPNSDRSSADAATALKQFQNKKPCWVNESPVSGYVAPLGYLEANGLSPQPGAFLPSSTALMRALYVTGICDFGATFSGTGDPRTSPSVTTDLTDVVNRVVIIWQSDPIIPNLALSLHPALQADMRDDLTFAFQALPHDSKGRDALSAALNYDIQDFKPIHNDDYNSLLNLVVQAQVDLARLAGK